MSENVQNLSPNQERFLEWLALPKSEREPATQEGFAGKLKVNEKTLRRWKKELSLDILAGDLSRELVKGHLPDVYGSLLREAKAGSFQHIKLVLEVAEHYTERRELTGRDGDPIRFIEVADDDGDEEDKGDKGDKGEDEVA